MPAPQRGSVRVSKTDEPIGLSAEEQCPPLADSTPGPPPKSEPSRLVPTDALPPERLPRFDEANQREIRRTFFILAGLAAVLVGLLWWWDPERWPIPMCSFYRLTGWYCPGCGGLRATHALLHGRLAQAWSYNPLVLLLTPWVGYGLVLWTVSTFWPHRAWPGRWLYSPWVFLLVALAGMLFGILRNLPWEPFCHWAPGG